MQKRNGMTKSALVLGGGGTVGLGWEVGVLLGLEAEGIAVGSADIVLGTSAGSFIGAMITTGSDLHAYADQLQAGGASDPTDRDSGDATPPNLLALTQIFRIWTRAESMDTETCQKIGLLAREHSPPEGALDSFISVIDASGGWPDRLRVTVIDTESGAFEVWGQASGVPLHKAVVASCSVPGIFGPVTIGERRYMDGGVRSGTNAETLLDDDVKEVLIVAPLSDPKASGIGPLMHRCSEQEIEALEKQGIATCILQPDGADRAAIGPNLMDATRAVPAFEAGLKRGHAEAAKIREKLPSFG